jgi:hypothetical protein
MNCEAVWNLISAEMDGELQADDKPGLEAHLAECAACRSLTEGFQLQDADLRRAFVSRRRAALEVADNVSSELRAARKKTVGWKNLFGLAAAACLGFGLATLLLPPKVAVPPEAPVVQIVAPPVAPAKVEPLAQLSRATGKIQMRLSGKDEWQAMETGAAIQPGTTVRTEPEALCELHTSDGSEVRLNEGAEVLFQTNRTLRLVRGQMWSTVARAEAPFTVEVPEATVTALGTKFDLLCKPAETTLTVVEGATRVEGKGSNAIVRGGYSLKIKGGDLGKAGRSDVLFATNWVHKLLVLKGEENEELAGRVNELLAWIGEGKMKFLVEKEIRELGPSCAKPLLSYIQSGLSRDDRERREGAASILADLAPKPLVHDLILLLQDNDPKVRGSAAKALLRLTGETQGRTPAEWESQPWESGVPAFEKWLTWSEKNQAR